MLTKLKLRAVREDSGLMMNPNHHMHRELVRRKLGVFCSLSIHKSPATVLKVSRCGLQFSFTTRKPREH
jgi:hypothetical protein